MAGLYEARFAVLAAKNLAGRKDQIETTGEGTQMLLKPDQLGALYAGGIAAMEQRYRGGRAQAPSPGRVRRVLIVGVESDFVGALAAAVVRSSAAVVVSQGKDLLPEPFKLRAELAEAMGRRPLPTECPLFSPSPAKAAELPKFRKLASSGCAACWQASA